MGRMVGRQSLAFDNPPYIIEGASVVGKKEGEGPLGKLFDIVKEDPMMEQDSWEEAESLLQKEAISKVLLKSNLNKEDIRYIFAGDLLGQLIASTFGILEYEIPFFGLYGACSTIGEALSIGAITVEANNAENVLALVPALGAYIHGLAGDIAAMHISKESMMATDIIRYIPDALKGEIK